MRPALLLGIIGVAGAAFFGYHRINGDQQEQVRLIRAQIAQEEADQRAQADAAALLNRVAEYRKRLPQEPDPSWLVTHVTALAKKTGIQFTTITQDIPQDQKSFTRLSASLQFSASYHQLGAFVDAIEHAQPFLRVDRIEVSASGDRQERVPMKLVLSTVHFPDLRQGG